MSCRPGLYSSRRRSLLTDLTTPMRKPSVKPTAEVYSTAYAAVKAKLERARSGSVDRALLWDRPTLEFDAYWSEVRVLCPAVMGSPPYTWLSYDIYGQSIAENWVCDGSPTGQVGNACFSSCMRSVLLRVPLGVA